MYSLPLTHTNERQPCKAIGILFIPEHSSHIKSILKIDIVAKVSNIHIQCLSSFLKSWTDKIK